MKKASLILLLMVVAAVVLQGCRNKEKCAAYDQVPAELSEE